MKIIGEKNSGGLRAATAVAATLIIIAAAALAFLYRDQLLPEALRGRLSPGASGRSGEPYTYDNGSSQVFDVFGANLAVATTSGLQVLDGDGYTVAREYFSMKTPAIAVSDASAVFFDVGGYALRVADAAGGCVGLDAENKIINASVNKNGIIAVVTESPGYKALVTVYNDALEPLYKWYSGAARVLSARVSPSGREMAALCLGEEGSSIVVFSLNKEEPKAELELPGELFLDMRYMGENLLAAVSGGRLVFIDAGDGKERGSFDYEGRHLIDYDLRGDGFAVLMLGKYRTGSESELITVGANGDLLASLPMTQAADSICAGGRRILVLYGGRLVMYGETLEIVGERDGVLGVRGALLYGRSDCLLVTAYTAEPFSF